jgi:hypothetical protein
MEEFPDKWFVDKLKVEMNLLFVAQSVMAGADGERKTEVLSSRPSEIPEHIYEKGDRVAII